MKLSKKWLLHFFVFVASSRGKWHNKQKINTPKVIFLSFYFFGCPSLINFAV